MKECIRRYGLVAPFTQPIAISISIPVYFRNIPAPPASFYSGISRMVNLRHRMYR